VIGYPHSASNFKIEDALHLGRDVMGVRREGGILVGLRNQGFGHVVIDLVLAR